MGTGLLSGWGYVGRIGLKTLKQTHNSFPRSLLQEPTAEHLQEALQVLVAEQQDLSHQAAQSMLSLSRLGQRLVVLERCCIALHRKGLSLGAAGEGGHEGEEAEGEKSEVDAKESETKKEQAKGRSEKMGR